jgi:hypothetical protein
MTTGISAEAGSRRGKAGEPKMRKRRLATTFVFTTLFFAGASLAAVAGNRFSASISEDNSAAIESTTTTQPTIRRPTPLRRLTRSAAPAADASADATTPSRQLLLLRRLTPPAPTTPPTARTRRPGTSDGGFTQVSNGSSTSSAQDSAGATGTTSSSKGHRARRSGGRRNDAQAQWQQLRKVLLPKTKPAPKPEIEGPESAATIWLNSPLPDPTPPADRLSPKFAANLKQAAQRNGIDWATMLGILRAHGATGHIPADRVTLNRLAARLDSFGPSKGAWARIVAYSGDSRFADKADALARYDRAIGLDALVNGLEASKAAIASRILSIRTSRSTRAAATTSSPTRSTSACWR